MNINIIASGSTGNAYIVSDGETNILLDAGIPIKSIKVACNFTLSKINACLITHGHGDHSKAVKDIIKSGIDIYTSPGTIEHCGLVGHRVHKIKALEEIVIGSFKILAFDVEHDAVEPLGFLLTSTKTNEKLLYFTDTYYLKYKFDGLTHIMAECNYDSDSMKQAIETGHTNIDMAKRVIKSHMSLENLLDMFKANNLSKVKQIYLLHLSDNNSNEMKFKEVVQKLTGAEVCIC